MISVCVATYNGEKYIKEQLLSILPQLRGEDELIVSDDGSTDQTISIIEKIQNSKITIIKNNGKHGFTGNFENALNYAKGDIIFLSDQDDVWNQDKVTLSIEALKTADLVVSNAEIVDGELNQIQPSHFNLYNVKSGFFTNFASTRYIGACMAFKRSVLERALPFPEKHKYCQHDWWITMIAEYYYKVTLIDKTLIKYRRHENNALTGGSKSTNSIFKILYTRAYTYYNLLKRKN